MITSIVASLRKQLREPRCQVGSFCPSGLSNPLAWNLADFSDWFSKVQARYQSSRAPLQQPVGWVDYRPGSNLESLSPSRSLTDTAAKDSLQPFAIRGAMQEGWPALHWTPQDLLGKCGDLEVPLEVSSGGGDYRDMYNNGTPRPGRSFEAGVPVPLSLLLQSMQDSEVRNPSPWPP